MNPEQWRQIEDIFNAACAQKPEDRSAFLEQSCAGNAALREEVESLLARADSQDDLLAHSPWRPVVEVQKTVLRPGDLLSHYRVEAPIGAGGMGEVFRAVDIRLSRSVAIKVCRTPFSERFRQEARVLSSFSHPHICTLFDVGPDYLVMELLDGETLEARLQRGPLSMTETVRYGVQIADALAEAHAKGVTHRDLKPGNVMLTRSGVKLLDFGLAAVEGQSLTQAGAIMGTPAYMAPEQSRGKSAGAQTDIYSLGVLLYEMATGKRPVLTVGDAAAALRFLPESLAHVIERCIAEDPALRWQSAAEVRALLDWSARARASPVAPAETGPRRRLLWAVALVLSAIALLAVVTLQWMSVASSPPVVRFEITPPLNSTAQDAIPLAVSRDGTKLAYQSANGLSIRSLPQISTTDFKNIQLSSNPFFSPDGEWLAFFMFGDGLKKVPTNGGAMLPIVGPESSFNPEFGGSWAADDTIIWAAGAGLFRVSADGGTPELIAKPDPRKGELYYAWPEVLPDGQSILFAILPQESALGAQVALLDLKTLKSRLLFRGGNKPKYLESGHLVYVVGQTLEARAFDLDSLEIRGEPIELNTTVATRAPYSSPSYDLSSNGNLAYNPARDASGARTLVWVDREGREEVLANVGQRFNYPRISPDGLKVALDVIEANRNIWILDIRQTESLRLFTVDPRPDALPVWSPDGHHLVFASQRDGVFNIYSQAVEGSHAPVRLFESATTQFPGAFVGATQLTVAYDGPGGNIDIGILTLDEPRRFRPLLQSRFLEQNGSVSPDGRWLAYESDESGSTEIHVRPFPDVNRNHWTISSGGGVQPHWSRDNNELFYFDRKTGNMMAAPVQLGAEFRFERARLLFPNKGYALGGGVSYDVSRKDGRFLMVKDSNLADRRAAPAITIVLNWGEEIKRLSGRR
jgi:serine/threonine protein kinase